MIELEPLCEVELDVGDIFEIGHASLGHRGIGELVAARWEGERLRAHLKGAAAADWALTGSNGVTHVDVRMTLETHDGALVFVSYTGVLDRNAEGAPIYSTPRFETSDPRYTWLNRIQAVAKGSFDGRCVRYEVYELR